MSPSYRIVFYVSGHGFGHASRSVEVIQALLRQSPEIAVTVKTAASSRLFERVLGRRVERVEMACDAGMVQQDSLRVDIEQSLQRAAAFQRDLPALAESEARDLDRTGAALVVGDIPPLAFEAAARAALPSVAIGNFTWDWIYESYPEAAALALGDGIRQSYRLASAVLRLPLSGGFSGLEAQTRHLPLIARQSVREPADVRERLGLEEETGGRRIVLMSFGSYGVSGMDTQRLAALRDYRVITTDLAAEGLHYIPEGRLTELGLRYEDLVRAADAVVSKPGYGIISEAVANQTALLYTSRGRFAEYDVLVREMPRYLRARFIAQEDLLAGRWQAALDGLLAQPEPPGRPATDGAEVAARWIVDLLTQNRR